MSDFQSLWIVGAGGFGREVFGYLRDILQAGQPFLRIAGFLDDVQAGNPDALVSLGQEAEGLTVKPIQGFIPSLDDLLVCGLGEPTAKIKVIPPLKAAGARFYTAIHPTASLGANVRLGEGVVIAPLSVITTNVLVGDFVGFNIASKVGHDAVIGEYSMLSCNAAVLGYAKLGRGVFMATDATVLPRATVGDNAIVGVASVVFKRAPAGKTVFGNPAMPM